MKHKTEASITQHMTLLFRSVLVVSSSRCCGSLSHSCSRIPIQLHHHSTTTRMTTTTTLSTRRRALGRPAIPVTHKDRLRSLETPPDTTVDEYIDRAQENLKTLETALSSLWNRSDGDPRPPRRGLKMDARWWFWNLQFAFLPAYCIIFYCELIGNHEMKEFSEKRKERQQRKALGLLDMDESQQIKLLERFNNTGTTTIATENPIEISKDEPCSPEVMAQRVQALERQLLLLRAEEGRRLQRAFQSGIERRHQEMTLNTMLQNSNETPNIPEDLGFLNKTLLQMAQQLEHFGGYIKKQGIDLIHTSWEQLSSQEQDKAQKKKKDTNIYPPPEEKMINEVDDDATFADTIQLSILEELSSNDFMTFTAEATGTSTSTTIEQAIGIHDQPPDVWWKTWAVMTGAKSPPKNETNQ